MSEILRDRHGDVWTLGSDGLMHSYETTRFSREHVERKWGPLVAVQPCDGSCHDFEYGIRWCVGCNTGLFELMCPDCQFYSAQDV